ncbi:uncharacterized protein LOC126618555 [Malus sylvestris]|uniref:uncharacterized protein LOC126618555 n=1 Tax=Malus sylvestris TaxID=3752 RepID=UPI0021AC19FA|nr:uncharacterized protein LOC126618555 [Malus sylvestris]
MDRGGEGNHCVHEDHTSSKVLFLAHRELKDILTRLGVLRWRFLDVGISRYASLKFWSEVQGFLGEIQWFWELEIVLLLLARPIRRTSIARLGVGVTTQLHICLR